MAEMVYELLFSCNIVNKARLESSQKVKLALCTTFKFVILAMERDIHGP